VGSAEVALAWLPLRLFFFSGLEQLVLGSLSQPFSFALVMVWLARNGMSGAGVP
jgi:hypothetical protein